MKQNARFYTLLLLFAGIIIIWLLHLFIVQNYDPHNFAHITQIRYNPKKIIHYPQRGSFYDRHKELLVASNNYHQVDIDCGFLKVYCKKRNWDLDSIYVKIANTFQENSSQKAHIILSKLRTSKYKSIMLTNKMKENYLRQIETAFAREKLPPLLTKFSHMKRVYAKGALAARLLGMVRMNPQNSTSIYLSKGITGLEYTFDKELRGKFGWKKTSVDARKRQIPHLMQKEILATEGASVVLTIDSYFQEILERKLLEGLQNYEAKNAIGLFMDVNTGEILCMASLGRAELEIFAKNNKNEIDLVRSYPNLCASFSYEPGSTMKPIPALIAIEEGYYQPEDLIDCRTYRLYKRIISDAHPLEDETLRGVIAHSSNVGISKVAEKVGRAALYERLIDLGFKYRTNSGLQGESPGMLRKLSKWDNFSLHSISFGQEISITPLQLVRAYAAIANGGKVMKPLIWREMLDGDDKVIASNSPVIVRTVSNPAALDTLRSYMRSVVEVGTATGLLLDYISIAGKTGTAEKFDKKTGTFSKTKYISSFAGFFPYEEPQIAGLIIYDEPDKKYHYGSMSAIPTFKEIVQEALAMPHSTIILDAKTKDIEYVQMPDMQNLTAPAAYSLLKKMKIEFSLISAGDTGVVINQYPKAYVKFAKGNKVMLAFGQPEVVTQAKQNDFTMPSLIGKTVRESYQIAKGKNLKLEVIGRGYVYEQSIKPLEIIEYGQKCVIKAK